MTHKALYHPRQPLLPKPLLPKLFTAFCAPWLYCLLSIALLAACQSTPPMHEPFASRPASGDSAPASPAPAGPPGSNRSTATDTSAAATPERAIAFTHDSNTIYFPQRVTTVDRIGKEKLRLHADHLKKNPKRAVVLTGHTDDLGSRSYNLIIAEERIEAVSKLLRAYGVQNRQILRKSVHKDKSPAGCISPECRQKMRRVELMYLP
jgi:outer membrane protein OmpA-like peptidoglycan-associated protein